MLQIFSDHLKSLVNTCTYHTKTKKTYRRYELLDSVCVCLHYCTFWRTRSVTMSLAWTSMVMRAVIILRCKVGSCPRTNAARAFSLWNTHAQTNKQPHKPYWHIKLKLKKILICQIYFLTKQLGKRQAVV